MVVVVVALLAFRLHAFLALMLAAVLVAVLTPQEALQRIATAMVEDGKLTPKQEAAFVTSTAPERVLKAFGETCGSMGLLIAMASIIGKCLLDSGAAMRIVQSILKWCGQARAHIAFVFTGFALAIPVYFDAVFYLLMPIGKAMARRTGKNYLLYILTVVAGATMAHSLVPPTPGPLYAAKSLGVDVGTMMVGGLIVGLFTASFGLAYALWANRRWTIELPEDALSAQAGMDENAPMPSLGLSLLPVLIPLVLITFGAVAQSYWFTDSSIAISLGAVAAVWVLARQRRQGGESVEAAVQTALMSGATILLITAAGGAFGNSLRQTGVADVIQQLGSEAARNWALPLCFVITALVRTAQGSATVAMITAAPIAAAFLESGDLGFHPVYLALAVGCGSKPIPWLNDSGFWIITRMSGMKEAETLKIVTPMMSLMGLVGLPVVMIGAWLFPMAGS
jgi:GntP family gluconate:H+ symporter